MHEAIEPSGQPEENAAAETWHLVELRLRASGGACVGGTPCGSPVETEYLRFVGCSWFISLIGLGFEFPEIKGSQL
jgi:hypothetical protein